LTVSGDNQDFHKYGVSPIKLDSWNEMTPFLESLKKKNTNHESLTTENKNKIPEIVKQEAIKIACMIADPLDRRTSYDFKKILRQFNKLDIELYFYHLTERNLNNLFDIDYIFIFSSIVNGHIIIEDPYLKTSLVPLHKLENMIGNELVKNVFIFTDNDFDLENDAVKYLPITVSKLEKEGELNKFLFNSLRKCNINQLLETCTGFNVEKIDLVPISSSKKNVIVKNQKDKPFIAEEINAKDLVNFVGRQTDIEDVTRKILDQNNQILTIKGSGGIGKTTVISKVALELAERNYFEDGIYFIDCEYITNYEIFEQKIANSFHIGKTSEFKEHVRQNYFMQDKLIILDNFEPLLYLKEINEIKGLINFICDYSQVVITSREWVGFDFENRHELRLLNTEEACNLFCKLYEVKDDKSEIKILKESILEDLLNNNPLAIKIITKVSLPKMSMRSLEKELKEDFFSATSMGYEDIYNEAVDENIERSDSVFHSINYSYKKLKPKEQLALEMLSLFPNGIHLENFKRIFDSKKSKLELTNISSREIKSLENKSLVETFGGHVKLQSIIGRFAEYQFEKRTSHEKNIYYKKAFFYNEYLADILYFLDDLDFPSAQKLYDNNRENFTKCIKFFSKFEFNKEKKLQYIMSLSNIITSVDISNELLRDIKSLENHFEGEEQLLLKMIVTGLKYYKGDFEEAFKELTNLVSFESLITGEKYQNHKAIESMALSIYSNEAYETEILEAHLNGNLNTVGHMPAILFSLGFYKALNKLTSPLFISKTKFFYKDSQFNRNILTIEEMNDHLSNLFKKSYIDIMQSTYIKAKMGYVDSDQIKNLVTTNKYTSGLKKLMYAFIEENEERAISLYKNAMKDLRHIKYYYIESMYFFSKYLKEINSQEYQDWCEKALELAKKYNYRFLIHQIQCLYNDYYVDYNEDNYPISLNLDESYIQRINQSEDERYKEINKKFKSV